MKKRIVLSRFQTHRFIEAKKEGFSEISASADLGLTNTTIALESDGVRFPSGECLGWEAVKKINASENGCFLIQNGESEKIKTFSELTGRSYSLMPTETAPTMLISGVLMHRIKGIDPIRDTNRKLKTVSPIAGRVLDTTTGLGYTAIGASKTAEHVTTVELDPTGLEIAKMNPWSEDLFDAPNIEQRIGDSFDVVTEFDDKSFTRILHDPPAFGLAGQLYSGDFYLELFRVLRPKGRLFHYIGNPESRSIGNLTRGVVRRLKAAGFVNVAPRPEAFGVSARKK